MSAGYLSLWLSAFGSAGYLLGVRPITGKSLTLIATPFCCIPTELCVLGVSRYGLFYGGGDSECLLLRTAGHAAFVARVSTILAFIFQQIAFNNAMHAALI